MRHYSGLLLTFEQLTEWIRAELVPSASPDEALVAWQKLAFRGSIEDYLKQIDNLTLYYPLPNIVQTLTQATQPLGENCKAGARRIELDAR